MQPQALAELLAQIADLPLAAGSAASAGGLLAAWLPAANDLSRKMSAIEHVALLPITVFTHAVADAEP